MIPYGRHHISEDDIKAVEEVLKSAFLTQGDKVALFEQTIAQYVGAKYAYAVNSATSALHIACLAVGLGEGDWLWTTPITYVASANCGRYCGADVDFVDIDPKTLNMSIDALEEKLRIAKIENRLPKVVVPVHLCGEPCDMKQIHRLSQEYGFKIIEDASHAIGAKYQDTFVGSCQYSDITVFSFHPVKIITTAEGGMAVTNNPKLAQQLSLYRSHCVTRDPSLMTHEPDGDWYYQQVGLGFNYRMTELQGALGVSQMGSLEKFIARRPQIAARYDEVFESLPIILAYRNPENFSSLHLYPIQVLPESGKTRKEVFDFFRAHDINVNVHYIPVHTQPYYQQFGFKYGDFPNAEQYYSRAFSIPIFYSLTDEMQDTVIDVMHRSLQ